MAKLLWPAVQSPSYSDLPQYAEGDAAVYDITQDEVYMHVRMIKLNSSAGLDGINSWILCMYLLQMLSHPPLSLFTTFLSTQGRDQLSES